MLKYFFKTVPILLLPIFTQANEIADFWCSFAQEVNTKCITIQTNTFDSAINKGFDFIAASSIEEELLLTEITIPPIETDEIVKLPIETKVIEEPLTKADTTKELSTEPKITEEPLIELDEIVESLIEPDKIVEPLIEPDEIVESLIDADKIVESPIEADTIIEPLIEPKVTKETSTETDTTEESPIEPDTIVESAIEKNHVENTIIEPTVILTPPLPQLPTCPASGTIDWICTFDGNSIINIIVTENASISNGTLIGNMENHGWVSNFTIGKNANLIGGVLTGYIENKGTIANFEFRGASIKGGILGGNIFNNSPINGFFKDVNLEANTHIIGGHLQGDIIGLAPNQPALLEHLIIKRNSYLENVIIGEGVELDNNVVIGNK